MGKNIYWTDLAEETIKLFWGKLEIDELLNLVNAILILKPIRPGLLFLTTEGGLYTRAMMLGIISEEELENYYSQKKKANIKKRNNCKNPEFRKYIFDKRGNQCQRCGSKVNLEIHHIKPIFLGGGEEEDNLELLCNDCHKIIHHGE